LDSAASRIGDDHPPHCVGRGNRGRRGRRKSGSLCAFGSPPASANDRMPTGMSRRHAHVHFFFSRRTAEVLVRPRWSSLTCLSIYFDRGVWSVTRPAKPRQPASLCCINSSHGRICGCVDKLNSAACTDQCRPLWRPPRSTTLHALGLPRFVDHVPTRRRSFPSEPLRSLRSPSKPHYSVSNPPIPTAARRHSRCTLRSLCNRDICPRQAVPADLIRHAITLTASISGPGNAHRPA